EEQSKVCKTISIIKGQRCHHTLCVSAQIFMNTLEESACFTSWSISGANLDS
ncbi:hypothetical protein U1Q18_002812, partial [Sarracenia purpurea var. burkii]